MNKKKMAMFKRWFLIVWKKSAVSNKQDIGKAYCVKEIKGYYNDLTGKVTEGTLLDQEGIPLSELEDGQYVHFPIAVFQYGLGCYDLYLLTQSESYKEIFLKIADWALKTIKKDGSWDCFKVVHSRKYNKSSMCQGEGASLLLRAYILRKEEKYLNKAEMAIDYMLSGMEGVCCYEDRDIFLEEYPQTVRRTVLNGWIFSLWGLYDLWLLKKEKYDVVLRKCMETLKKHLCDYDSGYWSFYDKERNMTSPFYHSLHIAQLKVLYEMTGEKQFAIYADKFASYKGNLFCQWKAVVIKLIQKLNEKTDCIIVR